MQCGYFIVSYILLPFFRKLLEDMDGLFLAELHTNQIFYPFSTTSGYNLNHISLVYVLCPSILLVEQCGVVWSIKYYVWSIKECLYVCWTVCFHVGYETTILTNDITSCLPACLPQIPYNENSIFFGKLSVPLEMFIGVPSEFLSTIYIYVHPIKNLRIYYLFHLSDILPFM